MNLSVIRDNQPLFQVDLTKEIEGNDGAQLTFFVGRSDSCQVVLDDKQVSREHAKITYAQGAWSIEKASDFNTLTLNGTFCDGAQLKNGDLISIGPYTINVDLPEIVQPPDLEVGAAPTDEDMEILGDEDLSGVDVGLGIDEATELLDEDGLTGEINEELGETDDLGGDLDDLGGDELPDDLGEDGLGPLDDGGLDDELGDLGELDESIGDGADLDGGDAEFSDDFGEEAPAGDFAEEGASDFESDGFDQGGDEGFNDDFADDGFEGGGDYAIDSYEDDGDEKTQVLKSFANFVLEIFGEYAPYDKFNIEKAETFIGRDPEKCDIVLNDPEVSGVHAVIKKNAITCTLEDLKSANGTILNGERINANELTSDDEFLIGSTTFTVKIQSDFIEQEQDRIMPVEENQVVEVEEIVEVDENFEDEDGNVIEGDSLGGSTLDTKPKSLFSKEALKDPQQRKKILYILVGLLALWVLLDE